MLVSNPLSKTNVLVGINFRKYVFKAIKKLEKDIQHISS
jgi:hypothetical protein